MNSETPTAAELRDEMRAEIKRLRDDQQPMACEFGKMTAAEDVLTWLIIEKIGVPDDQSYTPHQAQKIIEAAIDAARGMSDALIAADGLLRELGHSLPQVKSAINRATGVHP